MRARRVTSEASTAPITTDEARVTFNYTDYVIVMVQDPYYDDQWPIWVMRPAGRKVMQGTLFGFDDEGRQRVWIGRTFGLPVRAQDRAANTDQWTEAKRKAAERMIPLRAIAAAPDGGRCANCQNRDSCKKIYGDDWIKMAGRAEDGCSQWTPTEK